VFVLCSVSVYDVLCRCVTRLTYRLQEGFADENMERGSLRDLSILRKKNILVRWGPRVH
jgi:hypothetical protein